MSSDNKALIFFEKLDKDPAFQIKLRDIRARSGIDLNGFDSLKDGLGWLFEKEFLDEDMFKKDDSDYKKLQDFNKAKQSLIRRFEIPLSFAEFIERKIVFSTKILKKHFLPSDFGCLLIDGKFQFQEFNPEEYWQKSDKPYAKLLIHEGASKDSVRKYINRHWKEIEEIIGKKKRIRKKPKFDRDDLIYDFSKKNNKALGMKPYEKSRDEVIARLMQENGFKEVTADIVRKVVSEQRKLRSL